jgi:hypothetical protein
MMNFDNFTDSQISEVHDLAQSILKSQDRILRGNKSRNLMKENDRDFISLMRKLKKYNNS